MICHLDDVFFVEDESMVIERDDVPSFARCRCRNCGFSVRTDII